MKKILASLLLITIMIGSAFSLVSCDDENSIPSGMQLVAGSEKLGYYFYAPEEWTISNSGNVNMAYVSRVDKTSVSFVEVDPSTFAKGASDTDEEYFFKSYFNDSKSEFPDSFECEKPDGIEGEPFGKEGEEADRTKKYVYSYMIYDDTSKKNVKLGVIQYLLMKKDKEGKARFYIFTFTSLHENRTSSQTYYEFYLGSESEKGKLTTIIDSFRFIKDKQKEDVPSYPEKDGYYLISNLDICGFDLYIPKDKEITPDKYSSIFVSASYKDGSNFNMTEASETGVKTVDYMIKKLEEIETFSGSTVKGIVKDGVADCVVRDENGKITDVIPRSVKFGNANAANLYEYEYTYNGKTLRVYQVLSATGGIFTSTGYVFTYTAQDDNYDLHLKDIEDICSRVNFQ